MTETINTGPSKMEKKLKMNNEKIEKSNMKIETINTSPSKKGKLFATIKAK